MTEVKPSGPAVFSPLNETPFGRYDIRGKTNETITPIFAASLGAALVQYVELSRSIDGKDVTHPRIQIAICGDVRPSTKTLMQGLVHGITTMGADVINLGKGVSPTLYLFSRILQPDAAIMVTGSHNPPEYNGFKILHLDRPLYGESLFELNRISKCKAPPVRGPGRVVDANNFVKDYSYMIRIESMMPSDMKVAWDAGNGATGLVLEHLVPKLKGEHIVINGKPTGLAESHHPDPSVEENLKELIEVVREKSCDVGFAFDGDGDRIAAITPKGRIVSGDMLTALLLRDIPDDSLVLYDIKSSMCVALEAKKYGHRSKVVPSGHSVIKKEMKENSAVLAGEFSGHLYFNDDWYGFDDAVYAALRVIRFMNRHERNLDEALDSLDKTYITPEWKMVFQWKKENIQKVIERVAEITEEKYPNSISRIDGVRYEDLRGWWLIRASNTEPCITMRAEGLTSDDCDRLSSEMKDIYFESIRRVKTHG